MKILCEERVLRFMLRAMAAAELLAVAGVFMPRACMASAHEWLGLGPFPEGGLTPYLARHLAALYMVHGGFVWIASTDLRRYAGLVLYLAVSGIAFAAFITVLDLQAGFPWYWWAAEGPGLGVLSAAFLVLWQRLRNSG